VEIDFYHFGVLPRMPTNQMRVLPGHTGKSWLLPPWKLIFTTLPIDFYHRGNLFLPLWKLLFATIENT